MSGALSGKAAIITGGRRIGAAIALALAERGMNVALSFNRSRSEAERIATDIEAAGRRALIYQADLSGRRRGADADRQGRCGPHAARRAHQHGVGLLVRPLRPDRRARLERGHRRRPQGGVPLRPRRRSAHAAPGRRTDHQLQRLGGAQRPPALQGLPSLLRRQARGRRADRGAGAGARRGQHPGQRDCPGSDPARRKARPTRS